jgi:hypothetical protein
MQNDYRGVRAANVALGIWLFISGMLWPHSPAEYLNTALCGLAIAVVAFISMSASQIRFINSALSIWLFISAFVLPTVTLGTAWHNAILAVFVFVLSLVGRYGSHRMTPHATG